MLKTLGFRYCALYFFAVPLHRRIKSITMRTMGELYNGIKDSGANFIGSVETDGYTFDDSEAVIDGKFIGLPLDDINEDDQTDTRIDAWLAAITPSL